MEVIFDSPDTILLGLHWYYLESLSNRSQLHNFAAANLNPFKGLTSKLINMTKADIVTKIADRTGMEKSDVLAVVENFMHEVKTNMESGENVYLRGFGSFVLKKRAEKTGRNISKNTTIKIPAHNIPAFKPAKVFVEGVKTNVRVK